ncbi:hypothetical protein INT43_000568 [Umbelopsis isabellina]|uniref:Uncharacterized protein n=1 Tax=Mortierella isabellina TaxID=91625 RepID=A0A8H7UIS4_MORIS|nr:hypothetical protein INT43_000568 [Umbelopsis isabellina]
MSEVKSRKPANTAFKQQRLKAWQPLLTPKTVLPTLFIAGIIFAPLGGLFLYESDTVNEIVIDYTHCFSQTLGQPVIVGEDQYSYTFTSANTTVILVPTMELTNSTTWMDGTAPGDGSLVQRCTIEFTIPTQLNSPIYLYYRLTNFYQNHRKYVKSLSNNQLKGSVIGSPEAGTSCTQMSTDPSGKVYYPCGLIANSVFNDTFSNLTLLDVPGSTDDNQTFVFDDSDISWSSDNSKYGSYSGDPSSVAPPPNWSKRYPNGYNATNIFDPQKDKHFQVWMRTSWFPTFRKLYAKYTSADPLPGGTYKVSVDLNYDITQYGGTKSLVLTGTSFLGNRNSFMGLAYIVMGCICAFLGIVFLVRNFYRPRKLGDHDRLSWNNHQD